MSEASIRLLTEEQAISIGIEVAAYKGEKGDTGERGLTGETGAPGQNGEDGHTPVKGVDYWTNADKTEIVQDVLDALPDGDGVNY